MFCCGASVFGGGPIQALERYFAPVWFVASTTGGQGNWFEVIMTDPPQEYDPDNFSGDIAEALIKHINRAQHSIDIAAFEFNLDPVAEALIAAHNRGVLVRWITDDEHGLEADNEDGHGQFEMMMDAGIRVHHDDRSGLMHNKFIIFDKSSVWTGSTNLTENGLFRNNNNVIFFDSSDLAEKYDREFNELWRGKSGAESRSTVRRQTAMLEDTPVMVLFAPEDEVMDYLLPLVREADDSVRFLAFAFTHDELGELLERKARQGISVQGVFETRNASDQYSEFHRLYCQGLDVRKDGNPGTMHHKVFVIDEKIVVAGSFNFSNNANNTNDENMVLLNNTAIADQYLAEFERVWAEGWEPDLGDVDCR